MKTNFIKMQITSWILGLILLAGAFTGCSERGIPLETTSDVLMASYIQQDSTLSDFSQILDATGYSAFLNAYGVYTCFAPNNEAIEKYVTEKGKSSWHDLSSDELKKIVAMHVVKGFFKSSSFSDGKMSRFNMAGEYLTTRMVTSENKAARLTISGDNISRSFFTKTDIELGNGLLHVIDRVLEAPTMNLAQVVEKMRSQGYSIFADAVQATGLSDTLSKVNIGQSDTARRWFSILAESDAVFNANGIMSFNDLKQKFSTKNDPKDPSDSLYLFVAYRILKDIYFTADFAQNDSSSIGKDSYQTLVPQENCLIKRLPNTESVVLVLERNNFMKITKSLNIVRDYSDIKATNGVFHTIDGQYKITIKYPTPVYWEITEQPEVIANPNFRKPGTSIVYKIGSITGMTLTGPYANTKPTGAGPTYQCYDTTSLGSDPNLTTFGDYFTCNLRYAVIRTAEFQTPEINKGQYKIWICLRLPVNSKGAVGGNTSRVVIDDTLRMPMIITQNFRLDLTKSETALEADGYKTYTIPQNKAHVGIYVGAADFKTTSKHRIRFEYIDNINDPSDTRWDMVHFIPVEMNQLWPKFKKDGSMVFKNDLPQ